MTYHFCTLFDRNYLYKGLSLYNSLLRNCKDFVLWILCMDDISFDLLKKLKIEKAVLIRLSDLEYEELIEAKKSRTAAEYCWTCTPSLPLYVLQKDPSIEMITYLDADMLFYNGDITTVYKELDNKSVMIIEHRFPEHLKHYEINGIYNVSMVVFRNDPFGLECLEWWRDRCNEWCYYRLENGKMGDQKYLDDWPTRFKRVHVSQHKGIGIALWNIMRYDITERQGQIFIDGEPLIFYHFHQFYLLENGSYDFGDHGIYSLTPEQIELVYKPYIEAIEESIQMVKKIDPNFHYGFTPVEKKSFINSSVRLLNKCKSRLKRLLIGQSDVNAG